jgi:hypothetical protein
MQSRRHHSARGHTRPGCVSAGSVWCPVEHCHCIALKSHPNLQNKLSPTGIHRYVANSGEHSRDADAGSEMDMGPLFH